MKFNKTIINTDKIKSLILMAIIALISISMASCSDDDDDKIEGEAYLKLGMRVSNADNVMEDNLLGDDYKLTTGRAGVAGLSYFVFTNLPNWVAETEDPKDAEWVDIWPNEGKLDGRFYIKIHESRALEDRSATVQIKDRDGKVYRTFDVSQEKSVEAIWLSMSTVTVDYQARQFLIEVFSNIEGGWIATSNQSWLTITKQTDGQLGMSIEENVITTANNRKATVTIVSKEKPTVSTTFTVTQNKPA